MQPASSHLQQEIKDTQLRRFIDKVARFSEGTTKDQLTSNTAAYVNRNPVPRHFFSNEAELAALLAAIKKSATNKDKEKINIAILAGEAHFISCLPELSELVDVILLVDFQPLILEHNLFLLKTLTEARNPEEFFTRYLHNNPVLKKGLVLPKIQMAKMDGKKIEVCGEAFDFRINEMYLLQALEAARMRNPSHHFLNPARFGLAKRAAEKITILPVCFNLLSTVMATRFQEALAGEPYCIQLIQVSNLQDYDAQTAFQEVINIEQPKKFKWEKHVLSVLNILLPPGNSALIAYSRNVKDKKLCLVTHIASSIAAYQKDIESFFETAAHDYPWIKERDETKQTSIVDALALSKGTTSETKEVEFCLQVGSQRLELLPTRMQLFKARIDDKYFSSFPQLRNHLTWTEMVAKSEDGSTKVVLVTTKAIKQQAAQEWAKKISDKLNCVVDCASKSSAPGLFLVIQSPENLCRKIAGWVKVENGIKMLSPDHKVEVLKYAWNSDQLGIFTSIQILSASDGVSVFVSFKTAKQSTFFTEGVEPDKLDLLKKALIQVGFPLLLMKQNPSYHHIYYFHFSSANVSYRRQLITALDLIDPIPVVEQEAMAEVLGVSRTVSCTASHLTSVHGPKVLVI